MKPKALSRVLLTPVDGPASYKLCLVALGHYAHDDGSNAFPSVKTLTKIVERSRRTVQRALRFLEENGHIEATTPKTGGRGRPTVYRVLVGLLRRARDPDPDPPAATRRAPANPELLEEMKKARQILERGPPRPRDKIRRRRRERSKP